MDDPTIVLLGFGGLVLLALGVGRIVNAIVLRIRWERMTARLRRSFTATQRSVQDRMFSGIADDLPEMDWDDFTEQMRKLTRPE